MWAPCRVRIVAPVRPTRRYLHYFGILSCVALRGSGLDQAQLRQGFHTIVQTMLFDDLGIDDLQHGRSGEVHATTRVGRETSHQEIVQRRARMRATALPLADDIVALG